MAVFPVVNGRAIREAQESINARFDERLEKAGITLEMEQAIIPPREETSGLFTGIKEMDTHKVVLILAAREVEETGKPMTKERILEINEAYRATQSLSYRLKHLFRGKSE
jgi:hypothetical protein